MKIGIDCHNLEKERTGVGRYAKNLLEQWSNFNIKYQKSNIKNNDDIKFILYFHRKIPDDEFLKNPIFERKLLKLPLMRSSFLIYFLFLLPWQLKKDKVDLAFFPCYMVPITRWGNSIIVLHDVIFKAYPHLFQWRYKIPYLLFSWWGAKKSKAIITISNFSKSEIIKYYKVKPEKIFVTPLGVDNKFKMQNEKCKITTPAFAPPSPVASNAHSKATAGRQNLKINERYNIQNDFVLCLGQIFNRRHVDKVILAFQKIAPRYPELQLLIVGKNRTNPFLDIEKMIKEANNDLNRNAVIRKDYISDEDLLLLYQSACLSVYLSDYEGFGLPPLEAMACGAPVLTTKMASLAETVDEAALIVDDPDNTDEIAKKMEQGIADENLRQNLIKKGIEQANKFSWAKCAKETLDIFLKTI